MISMINKMQAEVGWRKKKTEPLDKSEKQSAVQKCPVVQQKGFPGQKAAECSVCRHWVNENLHLSVKLVECSGTDTWGALLDICYQTEVPGNRIDGNSGLQLIFFQLQWGEERGVKGTSLGKEVKSNCRRAPTANKVATPSVRGKKYALKAQDPDGKEGLIEGRSNLSPICLC